MKLEYEFTESQTNRIINWQSKLPAFTGNMRGRFIFTVQPTDAGTIIKIKDALSKEEIDVSEIS